MSFFNEILLARNVQGNLISIFGRQKKRLVVNFSNGEQRTTLFDIIESFSYKQSIKITENPVEQGVSINDHRIQQPMRFQMKVGVSNIIDPVRALTTLDTNNIIQAASLQIFGSRLANSRIQATFNDLQLIMTNGEPFDIDTPMGILKNFLIEDIENENNAESISTFEGTISFREILFFDNLLDPETQISGVKKLSIVPSPVMSAISNIKSSIS
jgi:hypothetical protein